MRGFKALLSVAGRFDRRGALGTTIARCGIAPPSAGGGGLPSLSEETIERCPVVAVRPHIFDAQLQPLDRSNGNPLLRNDSVSVFFNVCIRPALVPQTNLPLVLLGCWLKDKYGWQRQGYGGGGKSAANRAAPFVDAVQGLSLTSIVQEVAEYDSSIRLGDDVGVAWVRLLNDVHANDTNTECASAGGGDCGGRCGDVGAMRSTGCSFVATVHALVPDLRGIVYGVLARRCATAARGDQNRWGNAAYAEESPDGGGAPPDMLHPLFHTLLSHPEYFHCQPDVDYGFIVFRRDAVQAHPDILRAHCVGMQGYRFRARQRVAGLSAARSLNAPADGRGERRWSVLARMMEGEYDDGTAHGNEHRHPCTTGSPTQSGADSVCTRRVEQLEVERELTVAHRLGDAIAAATLRRRQHWRRKKKIATAVNSVQAAE